MGDSDQFLCNVRNKTDQILKVQRETLEFGKWYPDDNAQPGEIPAKQEKLPAFHASGRENSPSGTTGSVVYQLGDNGALTVTIRWDVPYIGSNTLQIETSDPETLFTSESGFQHHGSFTQSTIVIVQLQ